MARYGDVNEALQVKMLLESQGIAAFIPDEFTATNAPYRFVTDPSGVRVQVAEEDAETARQVVSERAKAGSQLNNRGAAAARPPRYTLRKREYSPS